MSAIDRSLDSRRERVATAKGLASGGGGPHDPDMEARVSRLEGIADDLRSSLKRIEEGQHKLALDLAEVKGRVSQMPTALQLLLAIVGVMSAAFAMLRWGLPHP